MIIDPSPEQMANPSTMMSKVDFSTAVEIKRIFSDTFAYPERFNACCFVSAYNPQLFENFYEIKKRGELVSGSRACPSTAATALIGPFQFSYVSPPCNLLTPSPVIPLCQMCAERLLPANTSQAANPALLLT